MTTTSHTPEHEATRDDASTEAPAAAPEISSAQVPSANTSHAAAPDYSVLNWLVLATFIVILNETVMVNAIPRLMADFSVGARAAQWLTSAFMLTMAVVIPVTGWILQRVTTRQAFTTAMSVFCAGTLVAAIAPTFSILLVARVVQASGTAVMMPLLMTTLMTIVHEQDRGRVMGNVTLAMSCAPALGPAVSGVILHFGSWRWMFVVVLPLAILVTGVGLRKLTNVGETGAGKVEVISVILSALGFGTLVYGLSEMGGDHKYAWLPWAFVGAGLVALAVFVLRQLRLQRGGEPLLDLRTLTHRPFVLGLGLMAVAFMAMIGSMTLLPLYLQNVRDISELNTGLLMMPGGLAMGVLGPQVGKVFDARGGRVLVVPGAIGVCISLAMFTQVGVHTSVWAVLAAHVLLMISLSLVFTPVFSVALGSLTPHLYSHGSSMLGALQQVAAATGTAIVIAVMTARQTSLAKDGVAGLEALAGGMRWGFTVGAICAIGVVLFALILPSRPDVPEGAEGMAPMGGH